MGQEEAPTGGVPITDSDEVFDEGEDLVGHDWATLATGLPALQTGAILGRDFTTNFFPQVNTHVFLPKLDFAAVLAPQLENLQRIVSANVSMSMAPVLEGLRTNMAAAGLDSIRSAIIGLGTQHEALLEGLRATLKPLADPHWLDDFNRSLLPPNLRSASKDLRAIDVHDFVESEGIPLYLVPRAEIGVRLVNAPTRAARRRVLGDRFEAIAQDCTEAIERCDDPLVATAVHFVRDGLGALKGGHHASAQAIFTLVLDTLIMEFYPDREDRKKITNRQRGSKEVPEIIEGMSVRRSLVWLPIWNAHEQFWKDKGDQIPYTFSRHASVHGASRKQYSKRNCIQVLMLVTSLIGYADQLAKEYHAQQAGD